MTIEVGFLNDDKGLVMSEWFDCSMSLLTILWMRGVSLRLL